MGTSQVGMSDPTDAHVREEEPAPWHPSLDPDTLVDMYFRKGHAKHACKFISYNIVIVIHIISMDARAKNIY